MDVRGPATAAAAALRAGNSRRCGQFYFTAFDANLDCRIGPARGQMMGRIIFMTPFSRMEITGGIWVDADSTNNRWGK